MQHASSRHSPSSPQPTSSSSSNRRPRGLYDRKGRRSPDQTQSPAFAVHFVAGRQLLVFDSVFCSSPPPRACKLGNAKEYGVVCGLYGESSRRLYRVVWADTGFVRGGQRPFVRTDICVVNDTRSDWFKMRAYGYAVCGTAITCGWVVPGTTAGH
eukprot:3922154-Rhodomonas_salina.1